MDVEEDEVQDPGRQPVTREPRRPAVQESWMEPDSARPPVNLAGFRATMREAGVEEIVDETLEIYVREAQVIYANLSSALLAADVDAVRSNAHSLKSSSGNIWATRLVGLLDELEVAARDGDLAKATELFAPVKPEYESVMAYLAGLEAG